MFDNLPRRVSMRKRPEGRAPSLGPPRNSVAGFSTGAPIRWPMVETENIQCPFCGQAFELAVDTSVASQRFTTDCEVCCRPFEVQAECETGEILSLDVLSG